MQIEEFFANIFIGILSILTITFASAFVFYDLTLPYFIKKFKINQTTNTPKISIIADLLSSINISIVSILIILFKKDTIDGFSENIKRNIGATLFLSIFSFILIYSLGGIVSDISDEFMDKRSYIHLRLKKYWVPEAYKDAQEDLGDVDRINKSVCGHCLLTRNYDKSNYKAVTSDVNKMEVYNQIYYDTKAFLYLKDDNIFKSFEHIRIEADFFSSLSLLIIILLSSVIFNMICNLTKVILIISNQYENPLNQEDSYKRIVFMFLVIILSILFGSFLYYFDLDYVKLLIFLTIILVFLVIISSILKWNKKTKNALYRFISPQILELDAFYWKTLMSIHKNLLILGIFLTFSYVYICKLWLKKESDYNYKIFNYSRILFSKEEIQFFTGLEKFNSQYFDSEKVLKRRNQIPDKKESDLKDVEIRNY